MGGGVAKAIRTKGGREIEREARAQAPIEIGTAVLTPARSLPCRYVLHAATMVQAAERSSAERVRQATLAALRLADQHELQRIAFPGMGTGVGRVPKADAARAMIETIRAFPGRHLKEVILIDRDQEMADAWQRALAEGQPRRQPVRTGGKETPQRPR
ncbi:MAG: macro domain-containing protein [Candidatus Rokubacteria bacterium]|nr:macro domain-containing protein [Candidatus Rokubacteria bacterium]